MSSMRCRTVAAELFYPRHLRSCAMTAYGSNSTGHTCHSRAVGESWLAFLGLENPFNALLQRILVLRLCAQAVSRSVLWLLYDTCAWTPNKVFLLVKYVAGREEGCEKKMQRKLRSRMPRKMQRKMRNGKRRRMRRRMRNSRREKSRRNGEEDRCK